MNTDRFRYWSILFVGLLLSFVALGSNLIGDTGKRIPVKWWSSIYAPSFGLDDDRVVNHQKQFLELYSDWGDGIRFHVYLNGSNVGSDLIFRNCGQIKGFLEKEGGVVWETDLDRFRFWIQASNCNIWKVMPGLHNSETSFLPSLVGETGNNAMSVKFVNELARVLAESELRNRNEFLREFDFSKDREIDCVLPNECSYDLPDDYNETYLFRVVAQGDYNKDGINDFFVSVFAPRKKGGYVGLVVTRRTSDGPLEIVAGY